MSVPRRPWRRLLPGLVVAAGSIVTVVLAAGPAVASVDPTPPPPPQQGDDGSDRPAQQTTWRGCTIVSGPSYIGGICPGAGNEGRTVKEILGKDPVPDCWDDKATDAELTAMGRENVPGPGGYTYYWHRCLTGVDKETKKVEPGGMHIASGLIPIPNGTPPITLTANQQELVDGVADSGNVPVPVAAVSPADHARVGLPAAFFNSSSGDFYVRPLGAVIHAHVVHTTIEPLGQGIGPQIGCPGNGTIARPGQTPVEGDGLCWYKYLRSSAGQVDDLYHVRITSHWVVDISADGVAGTFERIDEFDKSATSLIPVKEVQALVVQ